VPNGLKIPPLPDKVGEYRSQLWVEVHLLRHDVEGLKRDRIRLKALEDDLQKAKTWTKATAYFAGVLLAGLTAVFKKIGSM
tara:strand:+ start:177 stop:419 length:243 start_codon:yes stop_codon:yes gene_type:complete